MAVVVGDDYGASKSNLPFAGSGNLGRPFFLMHAAYTNGGACKLLGLRPGEPDAAVVVAAPLFPRRVTNARMLNHGQRKPQGRGIDRR